MRAVSKSPTRRSTKPQSARRKPPTLRAADKQLRAYALSLPGAYEEFPWDERVIKVNKKIFAFLGILPAPWNGLRVGVKLPQSGSDALLFPFAEPMGYNLGKSGWVTLKFAPGDDVPVDMLKQWIEESYAAVAGKSGLSSSDRQPPGAAR